CSIGWSPSASASRGSRSPPRQGGKHSPVLLCRSWGVERKDMLKMLS
ncbi:MAG: Homoserine O-acetyltransferase, partial [uncultured Rubrobacteraceae bacterium]